MDILLAIKPLYANSILNGKKTVEFRKIVFKQNVDKVYIYSSSPVQRIVGYFTISKVVCGEPSELWNTYGHRGEIAKASFFDYFSTKKTGFAIIVNSVCRFEYPIDPKLIINNFKAPQSFMYIHSIIDVECNTQ